MMFGKQGYAGSRYAASLEEFGELLPLNAAGGYLLRRAIPGTEHSDAMGLYPLFQCDEWSALPTDLAKLPAELCSVVLVVDPLENVSPGELGSIFPDLCRPFKQHFLVDLSNDLKQVVSRHHRYYAGYGAKHCTIRMQDECVMLLNDWVRLYEQLAQRHQIRGIQRFSQDSFRSQLRLKEMVAFVAEADDEITGIQLWICRGKNAYHHLSAYSSAGYRNRVSYSLLWEALQFFQGVGFSWINLGGGSGSSNASSGLTAFKKGWASEAKPAYLCGKILNHRIYDLLCETSGNSGSSFFPAYRNDNAAIKIMNEPKDEKSGTVCTES